MKIIIEKDKEPVYTHEEYLNLPDVKAADDADAAVESTICTSLPSLSTSATDLAISHISYK